LQIGSLQSRIDFALATARSVAFVAVMAISPEEIDRASRAQSLAGGICQLSGSLLAVIAGGITALSVFAGGGLTGLFFGGSATLALAIAGAPLAALGSIANSQKASKELLLLYIRESAVEPLGSRTPHYTSRSEPQNETQKSAYIEEPIQEAPRTDREARGIPPLPPPLPPPSQG